MATKKKGNGTPVINGVIELHHRPDGTTTGIVHHEDCAVTQEAKRLVEEGIDPNSAEGIARLNRVAAQEHRQGNPRKVFTVPDLPWKRGLVQ